VPPQPQPNAITIGSASPPPPAASASAQRHAPTAASAHVEEPLPEPQKPPSPPLRSISIEFTPDGARDVRVRLGEHAGDVHISLHSTDAALTSKLSDGVHDLVGTLTNAGYDAQAWTPGQERHARPQYEGPRRPRRSNDNRDTGEFGAILKQPKEGN
jgi:hypothetical protein